MSGNITSKIQQAPAFYTTDGQSHATIDLAISWQKELDDMELRNGMNRILDSLLPTCKNDQSVIDETLLRNALWNYRREFRNILEQFDRT